MRFAVLLCALCALQASGALAASRRQLLQGGITAAQLPEGTLAIDLVPFSASCFSWSADDSGFGFFNETAHVTPLPAAKMPAEADIQDALGVLCNGTIDEAAAFFGDAVAAGGAEAAAAVAAAELPDYGCADEAGFEVLVAAVQNFTDSAVELAAQDPAATLQILENYAQASRDVGSPHCITVAVIDDTGDAVFEERLTSGTLVDGPDPANADADDGLATDATAGTGTTDAEAGGATVTGTTEADAGAVDSAAPVDGASQ